MCAQRSAIPAALASAALDRCHRLVRCRVAREYRRPEGAVGRAELCDPTEQDLWGLDRIPVSSAEPYAEHSCSDQKTIQARARVAYDRPIAIVKGYTHADLVSHVAGAFVAKANGSGARRGRAP